MTKFLFVLTRGFEDPVRGIMRCLNLASEAVDMGHDVTLFLTDEAVMLSQPGMVNIAGDQAKTYLENLINKNVPICVCKGCAIAHKLAEEGLVRNARFCAVNNLIEMSIDSKVFTF